MPSRPNPHNLRIVGGTHARITLDYQAALYALDTLVREALRQRGALDTPDITRAKARLSVASAAIQSAQPPTAAMSPESTESTESLELQVMRQKIAQARVQAARRRAGSSSSSTPRRGA